MLERVWTKVDEAWARREHNELKHPFTTEPNLQEVLHGAEASDMRRIAARAFALLTTEIRLSRIEGPSLGYEVEVTDEHVARADAFIQEAVAEGWSLVPKPWNGDAFTQEWEQARLVGASPDWRKSAGEKRVLVYAQDVTWDGRQYRFEDSRLVSVNGSTRQEDLDYELLGVKPPEASEYTSREEFLDMRVANMRRVFEADAMNKGKTFSEEEARQDSERQWDRLQVEEEKKLAAYRREIAEAQERLREEAEEAARLAYYGVE